MAKTANKTVPTGASVQAHLCAIADEAQRGDCLALVELLGKVTGQPPRMWGPSIVGFGHYHYRYESGREGDMCTTGLAARGKDIVVYLVAEGPQQQALLAKLGKHRMGKSCLYLRRLADVDPKVLEALVAGSVDEIKRRYPGAQ